MRLKEIVGDFVTKEEFYGDLEIDALCFDSRNIKPNSLFFCLSGEHNDGKNYVEQAVKNGAIAVVCDEKIESLQAKNIPMVIVKNTRSAFAYFSAHFYGDPQSKLKIIGVVGTNGKTSSCHILRHILSYSGKRAAAIGTLGIYFENYFSPLEMTTPDPTTLYSALCDLLKMGAEYVVMEVSAHAIFYKKTQPIFFEALIFTNCTQDHLDFFKDFETYRQVKKGFLSCERAKYIVVNSDDEIGLELLSEKNVYSYAINSPSDVFAVEPRESINGISYIINLFDDIYEISSVLMGMFNVYNTLACATCAKLLGVDVDNIAKAIKTLKCIEGRMEKVATIGGANIFVDYAHTPDGLEKTLLSLRKITKGNLCCLFGCGGNRDKSKRSIMGRIAGDIADFVIVTSDNPRFEDPVMIMSEIEKGVRESSLDYICIQSRKNAINYALKNLEKGDTLLIAGKGAEKYQDVLGVKHEFNDKEVVLELIKNG